ncbi:MAG TPA: amino acid ABC transporter permease, partial [Streptomyces sp.]
FIITFQELLYYARYIGSQGAFGRPIVPSTIVATAIYVVMCLLLTALSTYLERRNRRNKKVVGVPPATGEAALVSAA